MSTAPQNPIPQRRFVSFLELLQTWVMTGRQVTIQQVLDQARHARFDGTLTIHIQGGIPRKLEAGRPAQLDLYEP